MTIDHVQCSWQESEGHPPKRDLTHHLTSSHGSNRDVRSTNWRRNTKYEHPESRLWDKLPRIPQIDLPTLFRLSLDNPRLDNFTYLIWQGSAL